MIHLGQTLRTGVFKPPLKMDPPSVHFRIKTAPCAQRVAARAMICNSAAMIMPKMSAPSQALQPERSLDEQLDRIRKLALPTYRSRNMGPMHEWLLSDAFHPRNGRVLHSLLVDRAPEYKAKVDRMPQEPQRYVACAEALHLSYGLSVWANVNWERLIANFGRNTVGSRMFALRDLFTMATERRYVSNEFVAFIQAEFTGVQKVDMRKREERSNGIKRRRIHEDDDLIDETSLDGARNKRRDGVNRQVPKGCLKQVRFVEPR